MSLNRYSRRVDGSQPEIVRRLEDARIRVFVISWPCDLLLQFYCVRHRTWCWQPVECKNPDGRIRRADQQAQNEFLDLTGTPVVTSFDEAWTALNGLHSVGSI